MKKIGIYGGSFDPPHFGHLNLAIEMMERHHLDEVWWIPVDVHPFQDKPDLPNISYRLEMVRLATEDIPAFKVLEISMGGSARSYTIDVLRHLKKEHPQHQFFLILGDDAVAHFHLWKEPEEIVSLATPLVGARKNMVAFPEELSPSLRLAMEQGMTPIPLIQISSTMIRQRLKDGLYCGHLVPDKVLKKLQGT